jgi:phosphoglycerate dehydrogenase-like enzyme
VTDLRIVVALPLAEENARLLAEREPRLEVVYRPELLVADRSADDQEEYERMLDSAEALFGVPDHSGQALARTVRANPRLRWVHTIPAGGGQQVKSARLSDEELDRIVFTNSAGIHAEALAEFAVFGVFAGAKRLGRLLEQQARGDWATKFVLGAVRDSTVLVVGLGGIGRATAAKLSALGARVVGVHRREVEAPGVERVVPVERFAEVAAEADAIVLCLPGTDATKGMLSAEVIAAAKPGVTVVNVGRGTTVDEPALIAALHSGQVGTAVLDVAAVEPLAPDHPLWSAPHVVISPHIAAVTPGDQRAITELVADNARRLLDGEPLRNVIDTVEFY